MGNSNSKNTKNDELLKLINETYAEILLDLNINELTKLTDSKNCNENVILLTNLLKKKPNKAVFLDKIHNQIYNDEKATDDKKKTCKEISEYYIKIANIYASIQNVYNNQEHKYCNKINKYINVNKLTDIREFYEGVCNEESGLFVNKILNKPLQNQNNYVQENRETREYKKKKVVKKEF